MKHTTFIYLALILLISCQKAPRTVKNNYGKEKELHIVNSEIEIDHEILDSYYLLSVISADEGEEIIVGYNDKTHKLDLLNFANNTVMHKALFKEGVDAIPGNITGLYAHNNDSIWLYSHNKIFLINGKGNLIWQHKLKTEGNEYIITDVNHAVASVKLFYNQLRKTLFYVSKKNDEFFVNEYNPGNDKTIKYALDKPVMQYKTPTSFGWKQIPNVTFTEDEIIYNYPIESSIYIIDINSGQRGVRGGKSQYTDNTVKELHGEPNFDNMERHKIENIHFFEVLYSKEFNCYFRVHLDKSEYLSGADYRKSFNQKEMYIMLFDKDFNIINESKLGSDKYNYYNDLVITDKGLLMFYNQISSFEDNKELLQVDILGLSSELL